MKRALGACVIAVCGSWFAVASVPAGARAPAAHDPITTKITFAREIRAILAARCAVCHAAGGSAPMPLTTYDEVRPWARAIKEQTLARRMPTWHAARGFGAFRNDPSLTPLEIAMVVSWVDGGLPFSSTSPRMPAASPSPVASAPGASSSAASAAAPLAASAFRRKIGVPAVRVAAGAADGVARLGARWVSGWSFEPGDPLITSATISLADGTAVGHWVAGDEAVLLPSTSAIRITSPVRVSVRRRAPADYEQPFRARASVWRVVTRAQAPPRRVWTEQAACGTPRVGRNADLLAIRPMLEDGGSARIWLERAGAPRTIVGWFRDFDARFPRTYWLARPVSLSTEARLSSSERCDAILTLVSAR